MGAARHARRTAAVAKFRTARRAGSRREHHFTEGSPQHLWLQQDMSAVDRSRTPWLVLVGHRPVYIDANDSGDPGAKQTTAVQLQLALGHLLFQHGVDVALSGEGRRLHAEARQQQQQ